MEVALLYDVTRLNGVHDPLLERATGLKLDAALAKWLVRIAEWLPFCGRSATIMQTRFFLPTLVESRPGGS